MTQRDALPAVFERLKAILQPLAPHLLVTVDTTDHYSLATVGSPQYPKGLFFGAVRVNKRSVSFHLMPVYVFPDLLAGLSPRLRKRMRGKSCFNFTGPDDPTIAELAELTAAGYARYRQAQLL